MQKTAYEMRKSDWSSDVCSSDLWGAATAASAERRGGAALELTLAARRATTPPHSRKSGQNPCWICPVLVLRKTLELSGQDTVNNKEFLVSKRPIGRASCRERECKTV